MSSPNPIFAVNPIQVWDLANGPPNKTLASFCALPKVRILVCGGDGTVAWILSVLEEMNLDRQPAIAVLPLGTGNDLARAHGWGGGYSNESLLEILEQVSSAYVSLLDRWEVSREGGRTHCWGAMQEKRCEKRDPRNALLCPLLETRCLTLLGLATLAPCSSSFLLAHTSHTSHTSVSADDHRGGDRSQEEDGQESVQ